MVGLEEGHISKPAFWISFISLHPVGITLQNRKFLITAVTAHSNDLMPHRLNQCFCLMTIKGACWSDMEAFGAVGFWRMLSQCWAQSKSRDKRKSFVPLSWSCLASDGSPFSPWAHLKKPAMCKTVQLLKRCPTYNCATVSSVCILWWVFVCLKSQPCWMVGGEAFQSHGLEIIQESWLLELERQWIAPSLHFK